MIVSTRGRIAQEDFTYKSRGQAAWQMPLVVLIDQDSASAAEIFAGAIRDHHRGTLVGSPQLRQGLRAGHLPAGVVGGRPAADHGQVLLAQRASLTPASGVEPDVLVHQAARPIDGAWPPTAANHDDAMLNAALEVARNRRVQQQSIAKLRWLRRVCRPLFRASVLADGVNLLDRRSGQFGCVVSVAA